MTNKKWNILGVTGTFRELVSFSRGIQCFSVERQTAALTQLWWEQWHKDDCVTGKALFGAQHFLEARNSRYSLKIWVASIYKVIFSKKTTCLPRSAVIFWKSWCKTIPTALSTRYSLFGAKYAPSLSGKRRIAQLSCWLHWFSEQQKSFSTSITPLLTPSDDHGLCPSGFPTLSAPHGCTTPTWNTSAAHWVRACVCVCVYT